MVQNMINVSVIIIGYNTEKYVKKCIESVILQSLTNIEIICVDDGSSDNTFSIMKEMSIKDERIKVYTQENSGPYAARKKGLDMAAGKYVVFIDSDDWIESEELMDAYVILEKYKLDMVFFDYVKENTFENRLEPNPLPLPENRIISRAEIQKIIYPKCMQNSNFSSPCTKMIRKEFMDSCNKEREVTLKYGEDLLYFLELYNNLEKTYYIPHPYYHYCIYSNESLSRRHTNNAFFEIHKILYDARKPYAILWNVEKELWANTTYLGLGEMIFDIRQKFSFSIIRKYLSDETFEEAVNNTDNAILFEVGKSQKIVLLKKLVKIIMNVYSRFRKRKM
jgi:glycosyltransferase EpsH